MSEDFFVSIVDSLAEGEEQAQPVVGPGGDGAGHTITHYYSSRATVTVL